MDCIQTKYLAQIPTLKQRFIKLKNQKKNPRGKIKILAFVK